MQLIANHPVFQFEARFSQPLFELVKIFSEEGEFVKIAPFTDGIAYVAMEAMLLRSFFRTVIMEFIENISGLQISGECETAVADEVFIGSHEKNRRPCWCDVAFGLKHVEMIFQDILRKVGFA